MLSQVPQSVAGKCNPGLHFTPQSGLALGDRSGELAIPRWGPPVPPDLYSPQEGPLLVSLSPPGLRDMGLTTLETGPSSPGGYPRYHLTWSPPRRGAPLLALGSPSGASLPPLFAHHSSVLSFTLQAVTHRLNLKVVH